MKVWIATVATSGGHEEPPSVDLSAWYRPQHAAEWVMAKIAEAEDDSAELTLMEWDQKDGWMHDDEMGTVYMISREAVK